MQETVPEEEWFIVENTHEPIISREDFASLLRQNMRRNPYIYYRKKLTIMLFRSTRHVK
ncbi:recombinase family protein [Paenibacillus campinasensis]|uniref:recombinase family protein n=1 Tax=Paenibacillus campinasensis TaxID=66347 RepID=UPI0018C304F6